MASGKRTGGPEDKTAAHGRIVRFRGWGIWTWDWESNQQKKGPSMQKDLMSDDRGRRRVPRPKRSESVLWRRNSRARREQGPA